MVEKLMLHLQYECHRAGLRLPWDKIVERLSTGSSGGSAQQHLSKLRDILITEGHMVPPLLGKQTVAQDSSIRGYVRDESSANPTDTRIVYWGGEVIVDRKDNLEINGVIRGSGNYRRGLGKQLEIAQKASGERRNRLPVELRKEGSPSAVSKPRSGSVTKTPAKRSSSVKRTPSAKRSSSAMSSGADSVDLADVDPEEDYDPTASAKKGKYGLRKKVQPRYRVEDSDDEMDEDHSDTDRVRATIETAVGATSTPSHTREAVENDNGLITPPSTKQIVLKLAPAALSRFPTGTTVKEEVSPEEGASECFSGDEMNPGEADESIVDQAADSYDSENEQLSARQMPPMTPLQQQIAVSYGYRGVEIHGLKTEYDRAIMNGTDPEVNGFDLKETPTFTPHNFGGVGSGFNFMSPSPYQNNESHTESGYLVSPSPYRFQGSAARSHSNNLSGTSPTSFLAFGGNNSGSPGGTGFGDLQGIGGFGGHADMSDFGVSINPRSMS
jgi:hypothetical protein